MAKTAQSSFLEKATAAHEEHKNDNTKAGRGGELPGGIVNGIAELTMAKIGVYKTGDYEGEPFFMAMGSVLVPKEHNGLPVKGLLTSAGPIPLCDTTNAKGEVVPFAQNWDRMLRHLRSLGLDTKDLTPQDIVSGIDDGQYASGPVLEAITGPGSTPIRFRFSTQSSPKLEQTSDGKWKVGRKIFKTKELALAVNPYSENPRVFHDWGDAVDYQPGGTADAVQDDTAVEPKWESDDAAEKEAAKAPEVAEAATEAPTEDQAAVDTPDFLAIAKVADNPKASKADRVNAEKVLVEHASTLGVEGYADMATWTEVAQSIIDMKEIIEAEQADAASSEESEEYSEESEDWSPVEGEIGFFHNPKDKAPVKCEFVKVYGKLEKVDLKRLDTNKIVKGVPFNKVAATDLPF